MARKARSNARDNSKPADDATPATDDTKTHDEVVSAPSNSPDAASDAASGEDGAPGPEDVSTEEVPAPEHEADKGAPASSEAVPVPDAGAKEGEAKSESETVEEKTAEDEAGEPTREVTPLCHIRRDGKLLPPGVPITVTRSQFNELKRAKAVEGSFDD
ncbi:hypothetical protein [Roseibium sediminis]|uniref:hypothetical protein n=1 Tax=Roseibium sediminis TaxID=1775174 RepID=UPI00123CC17C|nr:hypothetical protein [Roseibium sediminis]